jgi:hypothetical protein
MSQPPADNALGEFLEGPLQFRAPVMTGGNMCGLLLGGLFAVIFGIVATDPGARTVALVLFMPCALIALASLISLIKRAADKRDLIIYQHGIKVRIKGQQRGLRYDDMSAVAVKNKPVLANGNYSGVDATICIWRGANVTGEPLCKLAGVFKESAGTDELIGVAMEHILDGAIASVEARLQRGETVAGHNFQLSKERLRIGNEDIPLDTIVHAAYFNEQVNLWRRNEEIPSIVMQPEHANVIPLMSIMQKRLEDGEVPDIPGLGRVLFEKSSKKSSAIAVAVIGVVTLLVALLMLVGLFGPDLGIGAAVAGFIGFIFALAGVGMWVGYFRCHEKGVCQRGILGEKQLKFLDIETFTHSATRQYVNGAYTGTTLVMTFTPDKGTNLKPITYTTTVQTNESDIETLREHIANVLAVKMLKIVEDGGTIQWGDCQVDASGITYRASKFIGKGEEKRLTYDNLAGFNMHEGFLYLFDEAEEEAVLNMMTSVANFYPGFMVVCTLSAPPEEEGAAEGEAAAPPELPA